MLALSVNLHSQELEEVLVKIKDSYKNTTKLHLKMTMQAYSKLTDEVVFEKKVELKQEGKKSWTNVEFSKMIVNDNYKVVVIPATGTIDVYPVVDIEDNDAQKMKMLSNIDSIFTLYDGYEYKGKQEGMHQYRLRQKQGAVEWVSLFLNDAQTKLKRVDYEYREGEGDADLRVQIDYLVLDVNPVFSSKTFNETQWCRKVNGKWVGVGVYKDFEVRYINTK